jgi:hypothetical protein
MAKFAINEKYGDAREIDASHFSHAGDFTTFYNDEGEALLVLRSAKVATIERK